MLIIVGAGAAGLTAGIIAARRGVDVTILDKNEKAGRKILVSGNGRCNIANKKMDISHFHSSYMESVRKILKGYSVKKVIEFLHSLGIEVEEEDEGKLFPMSRQASSVVSLLLQECKRLRVRVILKCEVTRIEKSENKFIIQSSQGSFQCEELLLSSGSPASPQLGATNKGIEFAKELSHKIISPLPALVALESEALWPKDASGVKIYSHIKLFASGVPICEKYGDILFTDYGVSGLAVLDISREASIRLSEWEPCDLSIDLMPRFSKSELSSMLINRIDIYRNLPINLWLEGFIHRKLIPIVIRESKIAIQQESELNKKIINTIVYTIKNIPLPIHRTRDFRYAEVAIGGVDLRDIEPNTMESCKIPNLYFAGEILDVDGDRGGFNFHWAWTTGMRVGNAVGDRA